MRKILSNGLLLLLARAVFGFVFIAASIEKISAPEAFASSVEAYRLLPLMLVNLFSLVVPWIELLCGVLLVAGVAVRASAGILSALLVAFTGAIMLAVLRGMNIDCGCYGQAHATPVGWMKVLEDAGLLLLGIYLWSFPRSALSLESLPAVEGQTGETSGH